MRVKVIQPTEKALEEQKLRVCAYARVSTDSLKQEDSLENQTSTYERVISSNPLYEYVGIYVDQGISGCTENRPGFQSMLKKARAGGIDLIITKSVSRFARNTVTVLKIARELKELGVGIFFEEQNINTLSGDGELMLAVLASFAQEESRSISQNVKWGIKKKFERGEIRINTNRFMGYDKNEQGELIINEQEAKIVKRIFAMYLEGMGTFKIAAKLNEEGIKTVTGAKWRDSTILGMLKNEKYKGDYILQKYYTPDEKIRNSRENNGEVNAYYIKDNHPPIVSIEDWEKVQRMTQKRKKDRNIGTNGTVKYKNRYPLSGMLICPHCGKSLRRMHGYGNRIEWRCSTYIKKGKAACKGITIRDEIVSQESITELTVIKEVWINGEKHYCYTSREDYNNGLQDKPKTLIKEDGGLLPGVNRPRRTAIKL